MNRQLQSPCLRRKQDDVVAEYMFANLRVAAEVTKVAVKPYCRCSWVLPFSVGESDFRNSAANQAKSAGSFI